MPVVGVECVRGRISLEGCRACSLDPKHPCQYTPDILALLRRDNDKEPVGTALTPSRLLHCFRQGVLEEQNDVWLDIDVAWSMSRGHIIHGGMEQQTWPGAYRVIRERRFTTSVDTEKGPQKFSAKPDIIVVNSADAESIHITIVDYKSRNFQHELVEADREHQMQINLYAWIAKRELPKYMKLPKATVVVDELQIQYISLSKCRRFTSLGPLEAVGKKITGTRPAEYEVLTLPAIRVVSDERLSAFVKARILSKLRSLEVLPPPLEGDAAKWCFRCSVRQACLVAAKRDTEAA